MGIDNKYVHEAYSAIFQQDFKRAIDSFRKAISCSPKNHNLYYKLSITYARNNELIQAIQSIKEAIRLTTNKPSYEFHLQSLLIRQLAFDAREALDKQEDVFPYIETLKQFIEVDPIQLELKWILGLIYVSIGEYTKADEQMNEILKIDPEHSQALHYFENRSEGDQHVH
jgi:tetratricopeptide (TPR) repeat protein